ncbi:MAG: fused MFS/spermidine synthase [Pirellulaceae bacterium]|nr:fused MFS/spermidine synthase [Pirellulaceae bacterium]
MKSTNSLGLALWLSVTIFLSAFLLFQVQPLISKFILPWFGGSPAVWTTAMLFFQSTLFLGYVYSHLLASRLRMTTQVKLHVVLLVLASFMSIFVIPMNALKPDGHEDPTSRILLVLLICVGLPYLVLSTTGPLIQAWFSYAYPMRSPYRLFSLSNFGSFLALGSFPFLFEPYLELRTMGYFWMVGFWLFAIFCTISAWKVSRIVDEQEKNIDEQPASENPSKGGADSTIDYWKHIAWIGLSGIASLMFIATTNHVCHDIATVPFLWIVPLALYLLTFIICFDHPRWYIRELWSGLCVLGIAGLTILDLELSFIPDLILHFGTMFCICMVCHGELVSLRPGNSKFITEYYLMIAAGGALGGLFITLIATPYFVEYHEWTFGLIVSFGLAFYVAVSNLIWKRRANQISSGGALGLGLLATLLAILCVDPMDWRSPPSDEYGVQKRIILKDRNFYGTVQVSERRYTEVIPAEQNLGIFRDQRHSHRSFWSGSILHGRQLMDPSQRNIPLTYYSHQSGVGLTLDYCLKGPFRDKPLKLAVVGLGAGSLASYARAAEGNREADECVLYEINPLVEEIARNNFWYLPDYEKRLGKAIDVRLGDARLTMEREPPQNYDVIVLDAFSGDSVPAHLLTREAFEIYRRHLKKNADGSLNGFVCIHITNTFLNLYPIVKNAAEQVLDLPYTHIYRESQSQHFIERSHYFIITNDRGFLDQTPMLPELRTVVDPATGKETTLAVDRDWPGIGLWTDHYSTIFNILLNE